MIHQRLVNGWPRTSINATPPVGNPEETKRATISSSADTSAMLNAAQADIPPSTHVGLCFRAEPPPLHEDASGRVRVGRSRIGLDLVVEQYENGMTPEDMTRAYDTLELADVHAVIAYYLRNRDQVQSYLKRRNEEAEALRAQIEAERPRISRAELLARRAAREKANAPTGQ